MKQPIELRKQRDFGQIINDSFTFFIDNFKPLFSALLIITGFFIIASAITSITTYLGMMDLYRSKFDNMPTFSNFTASYIVSAIINALVMVFTQAFIHLITLCYISVYLQKGNVQPTFAEIWGYFKYYFFRAIGSGILIAILVSIAFLFCIIPGIYLTPIFYLIIPIIVIENSSFSYAFNKSFKLIKDNWWFVFGVILVMGMIVGVAGAIVNIPLSIITIGGSFFTVKTYVMPLIIIFSFLRSIILLAYALPTIAIAMCYFNLSEVKEGTGLLDRIERLGKDNGNSSVLPTEEY